MVTTIIAIATLLFSIFSFLFFELKIKKQGKHPIKGVYLGC